MSEPKLFVAVVDDEEPIRKALTRLLRSAGLEVAAFPSGTEFLASLKICQPDCVVLDMHMPQVNGFAVLARLAEAGIQLPIVVITGQDSAQTHERALAGGVSAYICKPVNDETLLDAITTAIATSKRVASAPLAPSPSVGEPAATDLP